MKHSYSFGLMMFFIVISFAGYSQTIRYYSYDNVGNRIKRTITIQSGGTKGAESSSDFAKSEKEEIKDDTFSPEVIKIFPNPSRGLLDIEVPEDADNTNDADLIQIIVMDISGKVIIDKNREALRTRVDLSSQARGIYILYIKKGQQVSQWKIIKQ